MKIECKSVKETLDQRISEVIKDGRIITKILLTEEEARSLERECYPYYHPSNDKKFFYMGYFVEVDNARAR